MFATRSAVQVTNLTGLVWLRDECRASTARAAVLFGLEPDTAVFYRDISDVNIEAVCTELDLSLFVPRFDGPSLCKALKGANGCQRGVLHSALQMHNLRHLHALCEACRRGPGDAVWTYRIAQRTADLYAALQHSQLVSLCRTLAVSAFLPRYDAREALRILDKPHGSRGLFAAAYETEIVASGESARRGLHLTH